MPTAPLPCGCPFPRKDRTKDKRNPRCPQREFRQTLAKFPIPHRSGTSEDSPASCPVRKPSADPAAIRRPRPNAFRKAIRCRRAATGRHSTPPAGNASFQRDGRDTRCRGAKRHKNPCQTLYGGMTDLIRRPEAAPCGGPVEALPDAPEPLPNSRDVPTTPERTPSRTREIVRIPVTFPWTLPSEKMEATPRRRRNRRKRNGSIELQYLTPNGRSEMRQAFRLWPGSRHRPTIPQRQCFAAGPSRVLQSLDTLIDEVFSWYFQWYWNCPTKLWTPTGICAIVSV